MNLDLQLGLIGLGVAGVGLVFAYNQWQERKHRKLMERSQSSPDVLLEGLDDTQKAAPPAHTLSGMFYTEGSGPDKLPPISILPEIAALDSERHEPSIQGRGEQVNTHTEAPRAVSETRADPVAERLHIKSFDLSPENVPPAPATAIFETPHRLPERPSFNDVQATPVRTIEEQQAEQKKQQASKPAPAARPASPPPRLQEHILSPRTECLVYIELAELIGVATLLNKPCTKTMTQISKAVYWVGYNEVGRRWEYFVNDGHTEYRYICVGLQLADRTGPVSEADYRVFSTAVQQLAEELMCVVEVPRLQDVMTESAQIDKFCAEVDMVIGLNLLSRGAPFPGTQIRALAESAAMVLDKRGRFCRYGGDEGHVLFTMQDIEGKPFTPDLLRGSQFKGLTFLLDVPRTDHGDKVFHQMMDLAHRVGESLNGALVDDNGQPLNAKQLEQIRYEYVMKPQNEMLKHGIPAGSPIALRLFTPA